MITEQQLRDRGWVDGKDNFGNPRLEMKLGRATYYVGIHKTLYTGVFVSQDPEELWSMSMRTKLFDGNCPSINDFNYVFNLVSIY